MYTPRSAYPMEMSLTPSRAAKRAIVGVNRGIAERVRDGCLAGCWGVVGKLRREPTSIRLRDNAAIGVVGVLKQRIAVRKRDLRQVVVGIVAYVVTPPSESVAVARLFDPS